MPLIGSHRGFARSELTYKNLSHRFNSQAGNPQFNKIKKYFFGTTSENK